ncbi:MAG: CsgG/HfaB family protein [Asticcacaulis sp.]
MTSFKTCLLAAATAAALAASAPAFAGDENTPTVDTSPTTQALEALPRKPLSQRTAVTIYQFRCGVPGVDTQAATDMFITALVKSGQFRVVERAQLAPGTAAEHMLSANGSSDGDASQHKLRAAQYIFEGVISENGLDSNSSSNDVAVEGMTVSHGASSGSISIDVRIIDADSGDVLDAVDVSQAVEGKRAGVQGVGNMLNNVSHGALGRFGIDADAQSGHTDSVDRAVRSAIEGSVLELVKRM